MYVCLCNGITDSQIRHCVKSGARCISDLQAELGVAAGCGSCAEYAGAILDEEAPAYPQAPSRDASSIQPVC
jgi:bacterioferritin-associated ferredoxin